MTNEERVRSSGHGWEGTNETFPPYILAPCRGRRRAACLVRAQTYPTRPVRIIVGFPPGGAADTIARLLGQSLLERLGQPFIIENRPGAAGNIGTEAAVRAPADGYSLLLVLSNKAVNAALYDKLNFNFLRDIAPVASIARVPGSLDVNPSVPVRTVPELIAYAKANPGKQHGVERRRQPAARLRRVVQDDDRS
jgi:tripartite-type tricarboxylate transporter receptor subunit TctC